MVRTPKHPKLHNPEATNVGTGASSGTTWLRSLNKPVRLKRVPRADAHRIAPHEKNEQAIYPFRIRPNRVYANGPGKACTGSEPNSFTHLRRTFS